MISNPVYSNTYLLHCKIHRSKHQFNVYIVVMQYLPHECRNYYVSPLLQQEAYSIFSVSLSNTWFSNI